LGQVATAKLLIGLFLNPLYRLGKIMNNDSSIIQPGSSLLTKIKQYRQISKEFKEHLDKYPDEWGVFQSRFNQEINGIFRDIMLYEKQKKAAGDFEAIKKFKHFFKLKLEKYFSYGESIRWSQQKPLGYTGDHQIIESIYVNTPTTNGFDRLFDNYMQMSAIAIAVRNRKEDFKRLILKEIQKAGKKPIRFLSLACGPSREWFEIMRKGTGDLKNITVDCVDSDERALEFSKARMNGHANFNYLKKNAVRMALDKHINEHFSEKYDFIYSTGLFDYLDHRVSVALVKNLKKLLVPSGRLAISDVQDKYSNPSLPFMELVGLWDLYYRDGEDFKKIFIEAGFDPKKLTCSFEQQGIMQYVIAEK
jgi:extracellular factor (EF) 3-hydroxypalmitic acid methyl ester biosynthesis protein